MELKTKEITLLHTGESESSNCSFMGITGPRVIALLGKDLNPLAVIFPPHNDPSYKYAHLLTTLMSISPAHSNSDSSRPSSCRSQRLPAFSYPIPPANAPLISPGNSGVLP